jgi:hypothetical protein
MTNILNKFDDTIEHLPLVALNNQAKLLYLAYFTRELEEPTSVIVRGRSSTGKSNLVKQIKKFLPKDTYEEASGMTEKAIINLTDDIKLDKKTLIMGEFAGFKSEGGSPYLRQLLSEKEISRLASVEGNRGDPYKTLKQEVVASFNVFMTTTESHIHEEDENRFLPLNLPSDNDYINMVLHRQVEHNNSNKSADIDFTEFHEASKKFSQNIRPVRTDYMHDVVKKTNDKNKPRLIRDMQKVISLIKAHTLLHINQREVLDNDTVISTLDDYEAIYSLMNSCFKTNERFISRDIEKIVRFVRDANKIGTYADQNILQDLIDCSKTKICNLCKEAEELGLITNLNSNGKLSKYEFIKEYQVSNFFLPDPGEIAA